MRCFYCDQRMWICSFHGAYHRDCHFYYFDIVSGFGPRLCSSRWGDICLFEKWQSSAKNAANFRVSTKTCPAYQFFAKKWKTVIIWWNIVFYTGKFHFSSIGHNSHFEIVFHYRNIGPAVLNGGLSTFLAFILLAFSNSYVFLTFFKVSFWNDKWCFSWAYLEYQAN